MLQTGAFGVRSDKPVNLVDESGAIVNADAQHLPDLLGSGYRLASDHEVAADLERQQYGEGLGNELAAGAEGVARGATMGLSDVAAKALAPEYAEGVAKRQEYNPISAGMGEGAGILGSALLTGGGSAEAGLLRGAARAVTAPTRAVMGLGARAAELAATEGATTVLGRAAAKGAEMAAGGAVENALFGAAKVATDDYLHDHDVTAERIAVGAGLGGLVGGAFGGLVGSGGVLLEEGARKMAAPILKNLTPEALDDFAGERAYKAALGGRNVRAVQKSERYGGPAEIGKTLLDEGVVTPTSTIEDVARAAEAKAGQYGQRIGAMVDEIDQAGSTITPRGQDLWKRIDDEVLAPLRERASTRGMADRVEAKIEHLKHEALDGLRPDGSESPLNTFRGLWEERRAMDKTLKYESAGPPAPELESLRKIRGVMDRYWQETSDKAAQEIGREGFAAEMQQAKRAYSHLTHADEIADAAIRRDVSNRFFSPSDYGVGAAIGLASSAADGSLDPKDLAYAFASGMLHRTLRRHGSAMLSGAIYSLRQAPKLLKDARAGEQAVETTASKLLEGVRTGFQVAKETRDAATPLLGVRLTYGDGKGFEQLAQRVAELADPQSDARQRVSQNLAPVKVEQPRMAQAMEAQVQRTAEFLKSKIGPPTEGPRPGDVWGALRKPRVDNHKIEQAARYVDAAQHPKRALDRIARGEIRREDVETLKALQPRLYQRLVGQILERLGTVDKIPPYDVRVKLGVLLGAPTDPTLQPQTVGELQKLATAGAQQSEQEAAGIPASKQREPKVASLYGTRMNQPFGGQK